MRFERSILIALVLMAIASGSGHFCKHLHRNWHSKWKGWMQSANINYGGCRNFKSKEQIQIYRPKGLRVTQNSANLVSFGMKVYINKRQNVRRKHDYWLNTTVVDPISKNFTLYEPTAVIRAGDTFDYAIRVQYKNGYTYWYDCKSFRVHESLIKDAPQADDEKEQETQTTTPYNTTVNDNTPITNTFVLAENTDVTTEAALREFIVARLTELLPAVNWNSTITEVFRWNSKFSFDVKTPEEKRKILRLLEKNKNAAEVVLDFDNMETLDNNDDYDYDEEE